MDRQLELPRTLAEEEVIMRNCRTAFVLGHFKRTVMAEIFLEVVRKKMAEEGKDFDNVVEQRKNHRRISFAIDRQIKEEMRHGSLRI